MIMTSFKFCFSSFFAGDINDDDQLLKTPDETSGSTNLYLYHVSTVVNFTNVFTRNFYPQLLPTQIPKAQKDSQVKQLFAVSGSAGVKAASKHIDKIDLMFPSLFAFPNN